MTQSVGGPDGAAGAGAWEGPPWPCGSWLLIEISRGRAAEGGGFVSPSAARHKPPPAPARREPAVKIPVTSPRTRSGVTSPVAEGGPDALNRTPRPPTGKGARMRLAWIAATTAALAAVPLAHDP